MAAILVQSTKKAVTGLTGSTTLAYGSNLATGNLLALAQTHFEASGNVAVTPIDTLSHVYSAMQADQVFNTNFHLQCWVKENCSGGADTVTFDVVGTNIADFTVVIAEFSGMVASSSVDKTQVGAANGTAANSGNTVTITQADEVIWGAVSHDSTTFTITETGSALLVQEDENGSTNMPIAVSYKVVSATGAYNATWTIGGTVNWFAQVNTLKALSGAGSVGLIPQMFHPGQGIFNISRFTSTYQSSFIPSGVTLYTLTADPGTYDITGSAAGLKSGRVVGATAGSYAITGTNQTLHLNRSLPAGVGTGSYVITGSAATLNEGHKLQAAAGSYVITGANAGIGTGYRVGAGSGTYTITGFAAALKATHTFSASSGTYLISGAAAALRLTHNVGAGAGAYVINGSVVNFIKTGGYRLVVDAGTYTIIGSTITLKSGRTATAEAGVYLLTGSPAKASFDVFPPSPGGGGGVNKETTLGFTNHIRID